jgi:MoxR-like ATPase
MTDAGQSTPDRPDAAASIERAREAYQRVRNEIAKTIVGQDEVVDQALTAIFCRGHAIIVGVPGLAKTLLISTLAKALSLGFSRVQFTPDLMPSDITGTEVIEEDKATGARELRFVKGPIFANIVLADEINRTPPKTQAALLEAMQERQVTVGGVQHKLPEPFFVLATQNPIEQEGTYPLPEAQLDRFLFQIMIDYPDAAQEAEIVRRSGAVGQPEPQPVLTGADIKGVHEVIRATPIADHVLAYALRLVRATRTDRPMDDDAPRPQMVADYVSWGAGPRASEFLVLAAKARAVLAGATHVTPEHVRTMAKPVLRHRILRNFNAEADRVDSDAIIDALLEETPVEGGSADQRRQLDRAIG